MAWEIGERAGGGYEANITVCIVYYYFWYLFVVYEYVGICTTIYSNKNTFTKRKHYTTTEDEMRWTNQPNNQQQPNEKKEEKMWTENRMYSERDEWCDARRCVYVFECKCVVWVGRVCGCVCVLRKTYKREKKMISILCQPHDISHSFHFTLRCYERMNGTHKLVPTMSAGRSQQKTRLNESKQL